MRCLCLLLEVIATVAMVASASKVSAVSGGGPADKPAANAKDANSLVSVSGMTASDYAACVSELSSNKVVFEQLGAAKDQGCELSGAIKLAAVATPFGNVSLSGKPIMLCSFAREFSAWACNLFQRRNDPHLPHDRAIERLGDHPQLSPFNREVLFQKALQRNQHS